MATGPGKYDDLCTQVRVQTKAAAVIVIVLNGENGSGFSCQIQERFRDCINVPELLEATATEIRETEQAEK